MQSVLIPPLTSLFAFLMIITVALLVRSDAEDSNYAVEMESGETESDEMASGEMELDEMASGKMASGEMELDGMELDEMASGEMELGEVELHTDDPMDANDNNLDYSEATSNKISASSGFMPDFILWRPNDIMPPGGIRQR
ncbi:unnamed protein product, partial [Acanthocheilonema viteae]